MKIFNWSNSRLILMFCVVIFLFAFTSKRNGERKLIKSEVIFEGQNSLFLEPETVNKLLIENKLDISAIKKDRLDLNKLEKSVNGNNMIETSQVFVSIDGVLKAVVRQKEPVARVFDDLGSFYIDYDGNRMPLSPIHTARVPLISGEIDGEKDLEFKELLRVIHDDDFLKKNIIGIEVEANGDLTMKNRNFSYEIDFGKPINIERKFKNYKAFFQKAILDSTLYNYKKINLKFTQQVVCTK